MQDSKNETQGKIHPLQKLMDSPWWLLLLGVLIPTLSYTVWGLVEFWTMGKAQLP